MNTATNHSKKPLDYLVLFGSPHENGSTKRLLNMLFSRLPDDTTMEVINACNLNIAPCTDCKGCMSGTCPFNSDGMGNILKKIESARNIIIATPIYFNAFPSKLKAIVDRMQQLFVRKNILNQVGFIDIKKGILLTTSGSNDPMAAKCIHSSAELFFKCINAELFSHIAVTNTDSNKRFEVSSQALDKIALL